MSSFSIIIPVKELNSFLEESMPIILGLNHRSFEVIILPDRIPSPLPEYARDKRVRIIPTGSVSPAVKRDMGARESDADYLAFLDDDAYPQGDWLRAAEDGFRQRRPAAVVGPAITPKNASISQKASGLFFETVLGGGGMSYRYRPAKRSFYVDDYPTVNFIVSRKAFFDAGGFDNDYWPGEDTKFCLDLVKKGYRIWYSRKLIVWHHRRSLFLPHLRQVARYGRHRGYFARKFPETSLRLHYFAPSLFLAAILLLSCLGFFYRLPLQLLSAGLAVYFAAAGIDVFSRTRDARLGMLAVAAIFLSHAVYGFMFIRGILSRNFRSRLR